MGSNLHINFFVLVRKPWAPDQRYNMLSEQQKREFNLKGEKKKKTYIMVNWCLSVPTGEPTEMLIDYDQIVEASNVLLKLSPHLHFKKEIFNNVCIGLLYAQH